jgi:ABC-type transport system involved in multi-copper enzyme maturation permease subunit
VFVFFALGMIVCAFFITPFTLGESSKIVQDIGLAAASLVGIVIAILVGSRLLYCDIKKKAVYSLITRPVTMKNIVIGKFLGISLLIFFVEVALHLILQFTVFFTQGSFCPRLLIALPFSLLEMYIILGYVFFFTSFSAPAMGTIMAIILYFVGHATSDIKSFAIPPNAGISGVLAHVFYFPIPNLEHLNLKMQIVHGMPLHMDYMAFALCYGIICAIILIFASVILFEKREFL